MDELCTGLLSGVQGRLDEDPEESKCGGKSRQFSLVIKTTMVRKMMVAVTVVVTVMMVVVGGEDDYNLLSSYRAAPHCKDFQTSQQPYRTRQ